MSDFNTQKTKDTTTTWLTPPWMLEMLGPFDLDPCAAVGRPWDCATINYTVEDNGLALPWGDRVWCNPPYGREAAAFMERMAAQDAPAGRVFAVGRLLEWQEVRMKEFEARRKRRALSCFLPPAGARGYGVARRIDD